jgi:hypothetical protein
VRPPPVRAEEPVDAVVGNREGMDLDVPQRKAECLDRGKARAIDLEDLGKVVVRQPEA